VETLAARLAEARSRAECFPQRPRVFFEEWDDPLISGIGWISELIEIAGGIDIFADRRKQSAAKDDFQIGRFVDATKARKMV
jgi:iron complex transport system substrate-binding protein